MIKVINDTIKALQAFGLFLAAVGFMLGMLAIFWSIPAWRIYSVI